MADAIGNSFLFILLPLYIASGNVTGSTSGFTETFIAGLVLGVFGLLSSLGQPVAGLLSDRTGRRKPFVVTGLALLALTTAAFAFVDSYVAILALRALQGLGVALTLPATIALVNEFSTLTTRGRNMGVFNTFQMVGLGIAPIVTALIVEHGPYTLAAWDTVARVSGFDTAFFTAAGTVLLSQLLVMGFVTDPPSTKTDTPSISKSFRDQLAEVGASTFAIAIASLLMGTGITLLEPLQVQVNARLGQDTTMFGIQFAAYVLGQVVAQAPVGYASDRIGRKRFVVFGLVLLAPAVLAQGLVRTPLQMVGARFAIGIAAAMVIAPGTALIGDDTTTETAAGELGLITMSFGLGSGLGPFAAGYLIKYGFVTPFVVGGLLSVLGAILVHLAVQETLRTSTSRGNLSTRYES